MGVPWPRGAHRQSDSEAWPRVARDHSARAPRPRLYQGDLLEGLNVDAASFEEWLRADRERLRGLAVAALGRSTDSARPDTTSLLERDFALELDVQL